MPITVTLDMYSGRPNPSWELTESQIAKLRKFLAKQQPSPLAASADSGRLGYRGMIVSSVSEIDTPQLARVFDGHFQSAAFGSQTHVDSDSKLEKFLLETGATKLQGCEAELVAAEIEKNVKGGAGNLLRNIQPLAEPPYDPLKWNSNPLIMRSNNCYNYGNDIITNTIAQPGRGSGQEGPLPPSCSGTGAAAVRDGQVSITNPNQTFAQGHVIALVISSSWQDYHWYRRDKNGKWSHKPGPTAARNVDNSGDLISSPETCDRGPYEQFCGYYHCIPANVRIR
ncbi:MAG: hypothetical protein V4819_21035 [Verrucomicrobiota bacterium]